MTDWDDHDRESEAPKPDDATPAEQPSLVWRVVKSAIAPNVLQDGGHDAPLSPRGRLLFWGVVAVLGIGILVLLAITIAQK